ncbi:MAG: HAD family hydrolase [Chloroflexi bacterium]|nr:HAD family hydrolase [Chloroflexota bacterium]
MHRIKAVLFDLDGTLIETDNRWAEILAHRLAPLRCLLPGLDTNTLARKMVMSIEMPGNYLIALIERLGLSPLIAGLADRVRRSKGLATRERIPLVEGTQRLIEALAPHYKLAVVTTRARPEAQAFVAATGLGAHFSAVISRQDVWWMKPHPAPVIEAARRLGVAPEHCLLVGDTVMDIRAAKASGAMAVGVLSGFGDRRELECAGADLILERADKLLPYLLPNESGDQQEDRRS